MGPALLPLAIVSALATIGGGVTSAIGQEQQYHAMAGAAGYNAALAHENAQISKANATITSQAGSEQAFTSGLRTRSAVGQITANQAASSVDVNAGSASDVRASARELGMLDALTIKSNAAKEAYGYKVQAANQNAQANLDIYEKQNYQAAIPMAMAGTILGSVGQAGSQFTNFLASSDFNSGS